MLLSAFFLFADQNLPASNLSRIAAAFGLTDEKEYRFMLGGLVNLPFFVLGGVLLATVDEKRGLAAAHPAEG